MQVLREVLEEVAVEGFADYFEDAGVDGRALEDVVTGGLGAVDLRREPYFRPTLFFQFFFYQFANVYAHCQDDCCLVKIPSQAWHKKSVESLCCPIPHVKVFALPVQSNRTANPHAVCV